MYHPLGGLGVLISPTDEEVEKMRTDLSSCPNCQNAKGVPFRAMPFIKGDNQPENTVGEDRSLISEDSSRSRVFVLGDD